MLGKADCCAKECSTACAKRSASRKAKLLGFSLGSVHHQRRPVSYNDLADEQSRNAV
jgi:hypothetical protein